MATELTDDDFDRDCRMCADMIDRAADILVRLRPSGQKIKQLTPLQQLVADTERKRLAAWRKIPNPA